MEITSEQAYSILGVVGGERGAVISKTGIFTVAYKLINPEAYSLHSSELEKRHDEFFQAFKNLPTGTYVHKQDVFLKKKFQPETISNSFIENSQNDYFSERIYLEHYCILAFSIDNIEDLEKSYVSNPLTYNERLSLKSKERINAFLDAVETSANIIKHMLNTSIIQLSTPELKEYLFSFVNFFAEDNGLRDIHLGEKLTIGDKKGYYYAICDEQFLPETVETFVNDNTLPTANSNLFMAKLEGLGLHLECNHIFNQVIWFEGNEKLRSELDNRVKLFGQHKKFSPETEFKYDKLAEMQKEVIAAENLLCRAHFSLMVWDDNEKELEKAVKNAKEILNTTDFKYYIPSYEGLSNIFIGNIIGRENKLKNCYYFLTDLHVALCLFLNYTTFKSDQEGVLFNDRIFQIPLKKDIWDAKKNRIPARNGVVIAGTGGGKSSFTLNIIQQLLEQNFKVVVCEFGKSFEQLTHLYPAISMHIDYDGLSPLGVNPFNLEGQELTIEKLKTLANIVLKFWRMKSVREDTNQVVSLTKVLSDYYANIHEEHSFPDFYNYLKAYYNEIAIRQEIIPEYFDVKSFLHICSEFMPGGKYENVCKKTSEEGMLKKNFIVFELTKVKKDPFLASLVMSILFDTIENKILADRKTKGMLIFDEFAEAQAMVDAYSGDDILSTVAFCYQKLRKENGAVMTIIQSPAQLPENNYTKGIISNTQLLYVLPSTEVVYNQVIKSFDMQNQAHINLMRSIRNDFAGKRPYSEIYMRFMDLYNLVVRLEFSPEKFFAFQTDGEDWQTIHEAYMENGDMEKCIRNYVELKNKKNNEKKFSLVTDGNFGNNL